MRRSRLNSSIIEPSGKDPNNLSDYIEQTKVVHYCDTSLRSSFLKGIDSKKRLNSFRYRNWLSRSKCEERGREKEDS